MDSLTQVVLGAGIQGALLGRWQGRKALLYGGLLGTLPDMDVLIDYGDAVADMTYHRGFSHSLLVLSAVAIVLTLLIRRFAPNPGYSGKRLLLTLWLVLATHPLLDSFTSYGTQLFWPLTPTPTAWSSIFIIDPLYTLPLLAAMTLGLIYGLKGRFAKAPAIALAISTAYLASTVVGKNVAEYRVEAQLAKQGIHAEQIFSSPTPFNSLLWRVMVLDGDDYYEALSGWFDHSPPVLERISRGTQLAEALKDSPAHARLAWFTDGLLRYDRIVGHRLDGHRSDTHRLDGQRMVGQRGDSRTDSNLAADGLSDDGQKEAESYLIVTDLRLGMTGFHPFRFDFAHWQNGKWQLQSTVERWPVARGDLDRLKLLWTRIWHPDTPVPLAAWASELAKPLISQTR
ncbi:metal-dependent hydrolase [Pseudomonas marincola]|uniref:metal-dependent hydrolase n=1 Tax=Pseudomonas marincola TaxID=437900 RepID=UPI0008F1E299|nr:metal-dependent hydrolase [Pseudomonas marincola]SFU17158.1 inner membrane protein [Pseudomonas marincola]